MIYIDILKFTHTNLAVITGCSITAGLCVAVQHYVKRLLDSRQYGYFRDIVLAASWIILALWFGSRDAKVVITCAMLAAFAGISENIYGDTRWRILYPIIGLLCTYFGPAVHFIRFPDGEYIYLSPAFSLIAGTLWFTFFPFIFRYIDDIPGLTGHVLAITFILIMSACVMTGAGEFFTAFAGMTLIAAFWSRFGNVYRQAGKSLSSMWGVIVAGTSIMSTTKGIVLSTVLFLSLGLFAIPAAEILISFVRGIITDSAPRGVGKIYGNMLNDGIEHPEAVQSVAGLCALTSMCAAWEKWTIAAIIVLAVIIFRHTRRKKSTLPPSLWGVKFDNVSMNYAVSKARGLILNPDSNEADLIVTLNAIGMETVIDDPEFAEIVEWSSMRLADGSGLCLGLKLLGRPVQERVAGIDFAENLCRTAAAEGWPVYFCGAAGDTALRCAEIMSERFPGLIVAGARDGYFDIRDESIPEAISASGAKILLAAMGQPRQEKWVYKHRQRLKGILCVGVGGAFDVFSGNLQRAPAWVQRICFEWLFRMLQEPGRWKNNLRLITFMMRIFASKLGLRGS